MRMLPDSDGARRRRRKKSGAHRAPRQQSALSRTVPVGGAALCIGVGCEVASPTAAAFSIVIPTGGAADGNSIQINILEGNIFNPQFRIISGNVSNTSTGGSVSSGRGNDRMASASQDMAIVLG